MALQPPPCPCGSGLPRAACEPSHDRACVECGRRFAGRSNRAERCPRCRREHELERARLRARERRRLESQRRAAERAARLDVDTPCPCGSGKPRRDCDPAPLAVCAEDGCDAPFHRRSSTQVRCVPHQAARARINHREIARRSYHRRKGAPRQLELLEEPSAAVTKSDVSVHENVRSRQVDAPGVTNSGRLSEGGEAD